MDKYNSRTLIKAFRLKDNSKIIQCLINIRKVLRDGSKHTQLFDKETFGVLISLMNHQNPKIVDYTLSTIANCCINEIYRKLFVEAGGVSQLILIHKTNTNESIAERVSRLLGNIASDANAAKCMHEHSIGSSLMKSLEKHDEMSKVTLSMTFRAIKKLWGHQICRTEILNEENCLVIFKCLCSNDTQTIILALEMIELLATADIKSKTATFTITKELLKRLVELCKNEELEVNTIICLSNIINYHPKEVGLLLEGSGIPELYISYLLNIQNDVVDVIFKAFFYLCMEGAVRRKVRVGFLLPKLVNLCHGNNTKYLLNTFSLFQYDIPSMTILTEQKDFIPILVQHISCRASVHLLSVMSRLEPPVMDLVLDNHLEVFVKTNDCIKILQKITITQAFLKPLLESGRVWEIVKAGCSFEHATNNPYVEGLFVHLLYSGDKRENVALSVPFFLKLRDFRLQNKLLACHNVMAIILRLLAENPKEERVLASVVTLHKIFSKNFSEKRERPPRLRDSYVTKCINEEIEDKNESMVKAEVKKNDDEKVSFELGSEVCATVVEELQMNKKSEMTQKSAFPLGNSTKCEEIKIDESVDIKMELEETIKENVTFEFDNAMCATVDKWTLCKHSPVFDAMLNGHFIEAGQDRVKLSCCSREALVQLVMILNRGMKVSELEIETHLELISLTDRFLIPTLHEKLTEIVRIDRSTCTSVYEWCKGAGSTDKGGIRQKVYDFLFTSSENLLVAMLKESCRDSLVEEITDYLSRSLKDLL